MRAYIIPAQDDQNGADRIGALLAAQGVELGRATQSFSACGKSSYRTGNGSPCESPCSIELRARRNSSVPCRSCPDMLI